MVCQKLSEENLGYKFFVSTIMMAKGDSGLTMSGACLWNSELDGNSIIRDETGEYSTIVNVFYTKV